MKAVGRQKTERLIELVQKYPFLYDRRHKHFTNQRLRDQTWLNISDELKVDCDTIKLAWNSVRNYFRHTIKANPSEQISDYHYADKLAFMRVHLQPRVSQPIKDNRRSTSDSPEQDDDNTQEEYNHDDEDSNYRVESQEDEQMEDSKHTYDNNRRHKNTSSDYLPSLQQQQPVNTTKCACCSGVQETFENFFTQALARLPPHKCASERPFDELDRFFLSMSISVRDTNITGMDLLLLKSKMLHHLFEEVTNIKNQ